MLAACKKCVAYVNPCLSMRKWNQIYISPLVECFAFYFHEQSSKLFSLQTVYTAYHPKESIFVTKVLSV